MNRCYVNLVLSVMACVGMVAAPAALAQTANVTASIVGYVSDASTSKPVANALVVATSPDLQGEQTTVTDDDGEYQFNNLPPGVYKIHVELANYKPFDQTDIQARLLSRIRVNIPLAPEQVNLPEAVVHTVAPVIDVGSATVGVTMTNESLRTIPVGFGSAAGANSAESAALIAPSANVDPFGISFAGSSSTENNYIIDGIPVGDPAFGVFGFDIGLDFIHEESVTTSGFMPEIGRAQGGIINIITKSGSNEFHGSVFTYILPTPPLQKEVFRTASAIGDQVNSSGVAGLPIGALQVGAEVGGPIIKDKLWFYAAFMPSFGSTQITRYDQVVVDNGHGQPLTDSYGNQVVAPCFAGAQEYQSGSHYLTPVAQGGQGGPAWGSAANPCTVNGTPVDTSKNYYAYGSDYFMLGKLTYALSQNQNISVEGSARPGTSTSPNSGLATPSADFLTSNGVNYWVAAKYNGKFFDRHLSLDATVAYFSENSSVTAPNQTVTNYATGKQVTYNPLTEPAIAWDLPHSLTEFENDPTTLKVCQDAPGSAYVKCPALGYTTGGLGNYSNSNTDRLYGQAAATGLFKLGGQHSLKAGLDYEELIYNQFKVYTGGAIDAENINPTLSSIGYPVNYQDVRTYGYQSNPNDPNSAVYLPSYTNSSYTSNTGFFIQDSFEFARFLTLNAGVRWEIQQMWGVSPTFSQSIPGIGIDNNIAPRIQAIIDPTRQGRSKIYAHWGRYYESIPLTIVDRDTLPEGEALAWRSQCVTASPTVAGSPARCPVIPNGAAALGAGPADYQFYGGATSPVAPGLQGSYNDVWGVGAAYEILPDMSLEVSYLDSTLGRVIEDSGEQLEIDGNFQIYNPGESGSYQVPVQNLNGSTSIVKIDGKQATTTLTTPGGPVATNLPWPYPVRRYQGLTVELRKQLSRNWELDAQYTYSRNWGNFQGGVQSQNGNLSPNNSTEYDLIMLESNKFGPLPVDIPNHFRFSGRYTYDLTPTIQLTLSGTYLWQSGAPIDVLGAPAEYPSYGLTEQYILPRGAGGRLPPFWTLDLNAGIEWTFSKPFSVRFFVSCYNVTDREVKTSVDEVYTFSSTGVNPISNGTLADLSNLKAANGAPAQLNPNFLNATSYQSPRNFRFNLALAF
jgi:hypothetical protein